MNLYFNYYDFCFSQSWKMLMARQRKEKKRKEKGKKKQQKKVCALRTKKERFIQFSAPLRLDFQDLIFCFQFRTDFLQWHSLQQTVLFDIFFFLNWHIMLHYSILHCKAKERNKIFWSLFLSRSWKILIGVIVNFYSK